MMLSPFSKVSSSCTRNSSKIPILLLSFLTKMILSDYLLAYFTLTCYLEISPNKVVRTFYTLCHPLNCSLSCLNNCVKSSQKKARNKFCTQDSQFIKLLDFWLFGIDSLKVRIKTLLKLQVLSWI